MKKLFFTVMMMIVGMTAMAQDLTYEVNSYVGKSYEGYTITIDSVAVESTIGCTLAEASAFAVQSDGTEDSNYGLGSTDGWRNADGDWQSWGSDAFFCVKADFSYSSNQIYYIGGMPGNTAAPGTYTATYKLYNPEDNSKSMKIFIKLNYKEIPVVVLSEMKEITPRKTLSFTQYPRSNAATTTYKFDLAGFSSLENLGIDLNNNDIANYLFVKQMDPELLLPKDELILQDGCWFQQLYDESGNELEECCYDEGGQDTYAKFQYYDFAFEDDSLSFTVQQNPGILNVGDIYKVLLYVVNPDTKQYVQLTIKLTIEKNPVEECPYPEMTMVGEQTIKLTRELSLGYTVTYIPIDIDSIASLFSYADMATADLQFKALMADNETLTSSYTTNSTEYGFWMDLESHPHPYSEITKGYFVNSQYALDGSLTLGHMPNAFEGGEKATGYLFFTYGKEYYRFNMDIQFGEEADPEDKTPEQSDIVATLSYEYQIIPNADLYQDDYMMSDEGMVDIDINWVEAQIGTTTPTLYGWVEKTDEESGNTYLAYSKSYSCDPNPGFWMIEPTGKYQFNTSTVGTWGTNTFGICYANGVFQFFQYPGQRAVGDVYDADFFLQNPKNGKMIKVHFTVSYVESRETVNIVGNSSIPVEAGDDDPLGTESEELLEEIYEKLGCDAAEFEMAGDIKAAKTNTTFVDKDNGFYDDTYMGFPFSKDGFVVDPNINPEDVAFYLGISDLGEIMAAVLDPNMLADGKTLTGRLAFDYGESRYILSVTLCADPTGIKTVVNGKQVGTGNIFNLAGQKVNSSYKGIVIENGKKVLK